MNSKSDRSKGNDNTEHVPHGEKKPEKGEAEEGVIPPTTMRGEY